MSNRYDFGCITCHRYRGNAFVEANHYDDLLSVLIKVKGAPEFIRSYRALMGKMEIHWEWEPPAWIQYLADHDGHDIRVFSEYGNWLGECEKGESYVGGKQTICKFAENHEGPCELRDRWTP